MLPEMGCREFFGQELEPSFLHVISAFMQAALTVYDEVFLRFLGFGCEYLYRVVYFARVSLFVSFLHIIRPLTHPLFEVFKAARFYLGLDFVVLGLRSLHAVSCVVRRVIWCAVIFCDGCPFFS